MKLNVMQKRYKIDKKYDQQINDLNDDLNKIKVRQAYKADVNRNYTKMHQNKKQLLR